MSGALVLAKIRAEDAAQKADAELKAAADKAAAAKAVADKAAADKAAAAKAVADKYEGPAYKIVTVDENVSNARLNQYWVYTSKFNYSTAAYKDQVKMIIADIARKEKTTKLIVQVVTDKEIIEAESNSTIAGFMDEHGADYFKNVIAPKENSDWVAWYTGGFDADTAQPSESAAAFEILWRPAATAQIEEWKPQAGSS